MSSSSSSTTPTPSSIPPVSAILAPPSSICSWKPKTVAGRVVKRGGIKNLQDFKRLKMDLKEPEIIDMRFPELREEILKVINIGRGQYQRKAYVAVGDGKGVIGLGKKCAGNDDDAIKGAKRNARLSVFQLDIPSVPNKTVPRTVTGEFSTVEVKIEAFYKIILAPPMIVKILELAGYNAASVSGNCEKATGPVVDAVFDALKKLEMK